MLANGDQKTHFGPHGDQRGSSGWAPLWKMSIALRFFSRCTPLWPQQPFFGQNISLKNKTWYTELLVPENAPRNLWNSSRVKITSFCDSCISYRLRQHLFWTKFSIIFYNCGIDIVITFWLKKQIDLMNAQKLHIFCRFCIEEKRKVVTYAF